MNGYAVWKFRLPIAENGGFGEMVVRMPKGARVLSVGSPHGGAPVLWAMVETEARTVERRIKVLPTGEMTDSPAGAFIGTTISAGWVVLHVFDLGEQGGHPITFQKTAGGVA